MKKITLLGLFFVSALFLSGCTLPGKTETDEKQLSKTATEKGFNGAFKAAIALGAPMKCSYEVDGNVAEGWIKGKQYLGKTTMQEKTVNILMKGECMWSWGEGETTGTKMCFETTNDESIWDDTSEGSPKTVKCRPAAITDAKFTPPSNVEFINMDNMYGGNMSEEDLQKLEKMKTVDFKGYKQ